MERLLKTESDNTAFLWRYAQLLKAVGKKETALRQYELLAKSKKADIPLGAIEEWYGLMLEHGRTKELRDQLAILSQNNSKSAILKLLYSGSCKAEKDYDEAFLILKDAYRLAPEHSSINHNLGDMYMQIGDMENALRHFNKVLAVNPLSTPTLRSIGIIHQYHYGDEAFEQLNFAEVQMKQLSKNERVELHYALGKAYDDVGELATAFEHFKLGGILRSEGRGQSAVVTLQQIVNRTKEILKHDYFSQNREKGCKSQKPVFVVGMPRSGTSLIEQILSSMAGIYGAGEVDSSMGVLNLMQINGSRLDLGEESYFTSSKEDHDYKERGTYNLKLLEALAPKGTKRIIDKTPINFAWLGYLHLILPNATIIHSRRHPVETCLSAYRIHFAKGQYWSDDLRTMGKFYRIYTELMQYWKNILPEGTILDVRYEDVVGDLEGESKKMAEHIGMEWDASCLNFNKSKRVVRTASVSQVRQPIYTSSINRWHKYEPYLKPLLDEIGDLVEAYEAELADDNRRDR